MATASAQRFVRTSAPVEGHAISRAVEKLGLADSPAVIPRPKENREWFVSSPGKIILFGEHAVVHGVVSVCLVGQSHW